MKSSCLFDLLQPILQLNSVGQNNTSVIAYHGSHGPALSQWALLMAFSTEEWITGLPSEDINTGIPFALMLCELPWFFLQPFSNPHWAYDTSRRSYKA